MNLFCLLLISAPLSLFLHELGHSIGAILVKAERIQLSLGAGKKIFSFSLGKFTIHLHGFYMLGGQTISEREPYFTRAEQAIIAMLGPLLNGLVGFLVLTVNRSEALFIFGLFNLWLCLINLIPYRIGAKRSDGFIIFHMMMKGKKTT